MTEKQETAYPPGTFQPGETVPRQLVPHDLMGRYLLWLRARYRPLTVIGYTSDLNLFLRYLSTVGESKRKRDIGPRMLDGYLIWMRAQGFTKATIERRLQSLRCFFNWAVARRYLRDNPFLVWDLPRAPEPIPRPLTPEQDIRLLGLLTTFPKTRYDRMVSVGIRLGRFAGLRVGECNRLRWEDVDLAQDKALLVIRESKGEESRVVPIPAAGLALPLRAWWEAEGRRSRGPVLTGLSRRPLHDKALTRSVHRFYAAASAVGATFHTLRTTFATRLAEKGVPVQVIQKLLGHKDIRTTMRYILVRDEPKRLAVKLLDEDL